MSEIENEAEDLIRSGQAGCVLIRDGKIVCLEQGRGVAPVLRIFDTRREDMAGGIIVDKVVGRAAAAVAAAGKAASVRALLMSRNAQELLSANGVSCHYGQLVDVILNHRQDDFCPIEKALGNCTDPELALRIIRQKLAEMQK